jgi:hypothetical protein
VLESTGVTLHALWLQLLPCCECTALSLLFLCIFEWILGCVSVLQFADSERLRCVLHGVFCRMTGLLC